MAGFGKKQPGDVIYFSSKYNDNPAIPAGLPVSLDSFKNYQANYNGVSQKVVCSYNGNAPFLLQISYPVTNSKNARIISSTNNSVTIGIPVGLS